MLEELLKTIRIEQFFWCIDLLLASILGFCIGLERKFRAKEAGIRTHTIVAFGSALMMVISRHAFENGADTARVAAQIVAGIGFLGAGIIVYKKDVVHGLTTAAGVWTTAGVGMACGGGLYIIAMASTVLLVVIQWVLHRPIFRHEKVYSIKIVFVQTDNEREKVKELFDIQKYYKLVVERKDENLVYQATIHTDVEYSSSHLDEIMRENPFILSVVRCDEN